MMIAHAEKIDLMLLTAAYQGIPTYAGTAGTTPTSKASILAGRRNLQVQKVPMKGRKFVMDPFAEAEYLELFSDADKDGSTAALREASLGKRFGLDTYCDQQVVQHTPGALVAGAGEALALNADVAADATSIVLKSSGGTLTGSVAKGDSFGVLLDDGSTQYVTAGAAATAAANVITITLYDGQYMGAASTDALVTLLGTDVTDGTQTAYMNNLMFHQGAVALAIGPQEEPDGKSWSKVYSYKGFGLRVIKTWNNTYKKTTLSCDILLGVKTIDGRLGTRVLG